MLIFVRYADQYAWIFHSFTDFHIMANPLNQFEVEDLEEQTTCQKWLNLCHCRGLPRFWREYLYPISLVNFVNSLMVGVYLGLLFAYQYIIYVKNGGKEKRSVDEEILLKAAYILCFLLWFINLVSGARLHERWPTTAQQHSFTFTCYFWSIIWSCILWIVIFKRTEDWFNLKHQNKE
jgi:hypothetical protein